MIEHVTQWYQGSCFSIRTSPTASKDDTKGPFYEFFQGLLFVVCRCCCFTFLLLLDTIILVCQQQVSKSNWQFHRFIVYHLLNGLPTSIPLLVLVFQKGWCHALDMRSLEWIQGETNLKTTGQGFQPWGPIDVAAFSISNSIFQQDHHHQEALLEIIVHSRTRFCHNVAHECSSGWCNTVIFRGQNQMGWNRHDGSIGHV
mmetsp:Transcript_27311/g.66272  ORF Transcript_27311/g.66272 Transcript_27311/m.66272 type:complete len:200 (+) Transcript_27311:1004-1603(+)